MVANGLPNYITQISLHHADYIPERKREGSLDYIWLRPLNGAEDVGQIINDNLATPYADTDELWEALRGFFNVALGYRYHEATYTAADLSNAATFGTVPGLLLFEMPANSYISGIARMEFTPGTTPYTFTATNFKVRNAQSSIIASFSGGVINGATTKRQCVTALNGPEAGIPLSGKLGSNLYLSTTNGTALASVGDGTIKVILQYNLHSF